MSNLFKQDPRHALHFEVLGNLAKRGVGQNDKNFGTAYSRELASVQAKRRPPEKDIGLEALRRCTAAGFFERDPGFLSAYGSHCADIRAERARPAAQPKPAAPAPQRTAAPPQQRRAAAPVTERQDHPRGVPSPWQIAAERDSATLAGQLNAAVEKIVTNLGGAPIVRISDRQERRSGMPRQAASLTDQQISDRALAAQLPQQQKQHWTDCRLDVNAGDGVAFDVRKCGSCGSIHRVRRGGGGRAA